MATTIAPSTGTAPAFLQSGPGASPGYGAIDFRRFFYGAQMQEGAIDAGSFEVTQRAAGANMSVDIAASTGNGALVQGDSVTSQGLYHVPPHSAVINEAITAADATNPRIDQVILEVGDDTHAAGGINLARVRVVAGTATGGATLDNRSGAASLPVSAVRLADVLVPASDTTISNSQIRDRRPWARGARVVITRTAGNYTTTSTTMAEMDATNMRPRLECSGVLVRVALYGSMFHSAAGTASIDIGFAMDNTLLDSQPEENGAWQMNIPGSGANNRLALEWLTTPAAGSHYFAPWFDVVTAGTLTVAATASVILRFVVEEIVSQNTANNSVTSG